MSLENKTILITGATGSFGKRFVETILEKYNPKAIRVFSRDELKQFNMKEKLKDERVRYLIGDIRDRDRIYRAMNNIDIVIHAAAMKRVCACEYNPSEAIKTNILGTMNVIDAAIDNEVEKVIFISTDKAVNPVNLYGATKLCAEKLFIQANSYAGGHKTKLSCSRYGNVAGSRGSVLPLFLKQNGNNPFTITDERMTRFWITLDQGVNFVINCIENMKGGEIFIPKLPSIKITDLVKVINPEAQIKIIGIRPGEKIHEVLLTSEEARHSKEFEDYFVIEPELSFWGEIEIGGKSIPDNFDYSSGSNSQWLNEEEIKSMLNNI